MAGIGEAVKGAQTFTKTIGVLNRIADAPRPPRFTDLLACTGMPKGTLHRVIAALAEQRLVRLDERDQTYRLGSRLFELAHRAWANFDLRDAAAGELQRLADLWRGTVHLAIPDGDEALIIDLAEAPQPFRLPFGVGRRLPLHATALGKAILGFAATDRQAELMSRLRLNATSPRTLTDRTALERALALAVVRGYAIDDEEFETGIRCVAAPILDHTATPIGAVSISQPAFRVQRDEMHAAGRDAMDAARQIAGNAGATPVFSISTTARPAEPAAEDLRVIVPAAGIDPESPIWSEADGSLWWVDIIEPQLGRLRPDHRPEPMVPLDELVSCIAFRTGGGLVAATRLGIAALDPVGGRVSPLTALEPDRPRNRPNDGRCDRRGRFWIGTMALDGRAGQGSLWRVGPGFETARMDSGFGVSNGVGWSPDDGWLYFVDSRARVIWRYPFDLGTGGVGRRETFVDFAGESGNPAGLAVDSDGHVWCAIWDGWRVTRFDPAGRVERTVPLPVPRPTSCTFGDVGLMSLLITTGRTRLSRERLAEAPLSGAIFAIPAPVSGQSESPFAG